MGVIARALECIPTFGPIIATIPAVIVALFQGSDRFVTMDNLLFAVIVTVAYVLIQQLESSTLAPNVMGNAVVLPPIIVLIAITAGLQVWGILGANRRASCGDLQDRNAISVDEGSARRLMTIRLSAPRVP